MAGKRVSSLGQCGVDHWSLSSLLSRRFGADTRAVDTLEDLLAELRRGGVDLVLVNRVLDADGGSGLDCIAALKRDPDLCQVPVMLVSNLRDAQREAIALGARPGFGKAELGEPATLERLGEVLGSPLAG